MTVDRPHFGTVAILGVGLLGGSLGMAMRRHRLADHLIGWGRTAERLAEAKRLNAVDDTTTDLDEALAEADLVVCCTPVQHIVDHLPAIAEACKPGALITDVGSTKQAICAAAGTLEEERVAFVGSHPMAGSDRTGVEHAAWDLFEDATVFVTIEAGTPKAQALRVAALWRAVGGRVVLAHPRRHDRLVAAVSHLPHLIAVAAVGAVGDVHDDVNFLARIIGRGFRDTTRVAQGSTVMWTDICATNPRAIVEAIDAFLEKMHGLREQIAHGDTRRLSGLLEEARALRSQLEPGA